MNPDILTQVQSIAEELKASSGSVSLPGLKGSAPAYLLARLLDHLSHPLLLVTSNLDKAEELRDELAFFRGNDGDVLLFPPWDTTPFELASPFPEITGRRLSTLFSLLAGEGRAVVVPIEALCQRVIPRAVLAGCSHALSAGEEVDRDVVIEKLMALGYSGVPLVEDRGTFSVRGGILDIFPPNLENPVRVEFFGDFIDTVRAFDPVSQRSLHPVERLVLLPSREMILSEEVVQGFSARLKKRSDELEIPPERRRQILDQVKSSIFPPGIEYLQPLFHPGLESLCDYLGDGVITVCIDPEGINDGLVRFHDELAKASELALEKDYITVQPEELFFSEGETSRMLEGQPSLSIPSLEILEPTATTTSYRFTTEENTDLILDLTSGETEGLLAPFVEKLNAWLNGGTRVIMACHQRGQAQRLYDLLVRYNLPLDISTGTFPVERERKDRRVDILVGAVSRGFRFGQDQLVVIAEEEIFGRRVRRRGVSEARKKQVLTSLAELKPGDHMVHIDFGVGIYRGLQHLDFSGVGGDFLLLEYAGGDKLYLPVDRISLVQRYVGTEGVEPHIDKLGGTSWEKTKSKALQAIHEMAGELLKIYAARQIQEGLEFSPPDEYYREFEAAFTWEETPDQLAAIEDVLGDMQSKKPMDRLICGDVGYGKTEVAMRGAFKAVMDGKQVAVLVPTTVLARQHLETFRKRFAGHAVTIEMLSRFRSPKEQKEIISRVRSGAVDIIIGTHRLLQNDLQFKDLGLLIVDEEQRFGVSHKEKLKKYRAVVDIMTLTATPIPRTLHMSLMGIRDLSIIDTPPVDRLAIKTFVARFTDELVREAVLRELRRGGQVFFVHNRVQSIGAMAEHLRRIVPEASIAVGHGQMDERELEKVMLGFMHGETNLLLCTTIIESGLDIPTANTLIVNRADAFGLAQLYQLRGRVGRSSQRAYAYFLIPSEGAISQDARERLKILQEITELGAGFRIATHDLELRGAGDLLGARQSGNIAAVGFELYTEMLEEAIKEMKGEELVVRLEPEIKLRIPAFIPEDYVKEPNQRLLIYKKLSQASSAEDIADVKGELVDRFGSLPQAAIYLMEVMAIRLTLKSLLIKEVEFDGRRISLAFHERTPVAPETIMNLIKSAPGIFTFTPDYRLVMEAVETGFEGVLEGVRNLLKRLG